MIVTGCWASLFAAALAPPIPGLLKQASRLPAATVKTELLRNLRRLSIHFLRPSRVKMRGDGESYKLSGPVRRNLSGRLRLGLGMHSPVLWVPLPPLFSQSIQSKGHTCKVFNNKDLHPKLGRWPSLRGTGARDFFNFIV